MSKNLVFLALGGIVLFGLFYILQPKSSTPTPTMTESTQSASQVEPKRFPIVIENKKLASGSATMTASQGDEVLFQIISDTPGYFHLHGYDKSIDLKKDEPSKLQITADLTGRFEIEFHDEKDMHFDIAALEVMPK